jgi:hypothetical protein
MPQKEAVANRFLIGLPQPFLLHKNAEGSFTSLPHFLIYFY